ncbi:MAG: hypothetical protein IIC50_01420 [Planctomycetes bacterium]|nr:hypothetical protein [Planctomycetota bacterium]
MAPDRCLEQSATTVVSMGKSELKKRIRRFNGRFRLDFSDDYLNGVNADRLRHILMAAMINARVRN